MYKLPLMLSLTVLPFSTVLAQDLRDPMAPFTATSLVGDSQADPLILTGVIIGSQRRVAIINGQPYRVGSEVGDYQVTAISRHSVEISNESITRKLALRTESMGNLDETD